MMRAPQFILYASFYYSYKITDDKMGKQAILIGK
jgi:hypothetical protein